MKHEIFQERKNDSGQIDAIVMAVQFLNEQYGKLSGSVVPASGEVSIQVAEVHTEVSPDAATIAPAVEPLEVSSS